MNNEYKCQHCENLWDARDGRVELTKDRLEVFTCFECFSDEDWNEEQDNYYATEADLAWSGRDLEC